MTTKICTKCKIEKSINGFYKDKNYINGLACICKSCSSLQSMKYNQTKNGVFTRLYGSQKANSKTRGMTPPNYTKQDFIKWAYDNNFDTLYDIWVKSGYLKELKPSADRLDETKPYTLDNIQLITWGENNNKSYRDHREGKGKKGLQCKTIIQLDKNMNIINEFVSHHEAVRQLGYHIQKPLKSGRLNTKGFYFKYKTP